MRSDPPQPCPSLQAGGDGDVEGPLLLFLSQPHLIFVTILFITLPTSSLSRESQCEVALKSDFLEEIKSG